MANRSRQRTVNLNPRTVILNPRTVNQNPGCNLKLIGWDLEGTFLSGAACLEIRLIDRHRKIARSGNGVGRLMQDRVDRMTRMAFRKRLRDFLVPGWLNVPQILSNLNLPPGIQDFVSTKLSRYAVDMAKRSMKKGFRRFHLLAVVEVVAIELIDGMSKSIGYQHSISSLMEEFISTLEESNSQESCAVCLEALQVGSKVVRTPCNHFFHGGCLGRWFQMSLTCPVCRFQIQERDL